LYVLYLDDNKSNNNNNTMMVNLWLSPKKRHSVERLRVVYTDLLQHIDADSECLGQRRCASAEDVKCHKKAQRFSFRRNIIPVHSQISHSRSNNDESTFDSPVRSSREASDPLFDDIQSEFPDNSSALIATVETESRDVPNSRDYIINRAALSIGNDETISDLAGAFRILAATRSPDKEGENFGAVATRDDGSVCGIQRAKALERRVVESIALIGEIVVNGGKGGVASNRKGSSAMQCIRTDSVFEYFCEKSILSLLVDIAKEKRHNRDTVYTNKNSSAIESVVHGVVWSGLVKAQVYETVSILISDVRNQSIIYYLLSNNYINDLIECMQPIQQWTEPAIAKMLPAYVDLLKNLTLQLADDPHLFPFLTVETPNETDGLYKEGDITATSVEFPLFSAALETASSYYAQSDSKIYATCLAIIINLMQIPHRPMQDWINQSNASQRALADHLCERLLNRFYRVTYLATGPVVDGPRHNAIANQLMSLKDHMGMVHEVVWSGVRGLDVRLCETLLQKVVSVLLQCLSPKRPFLVVGLVDADVIPESEASAQVSAIVFSFMFSSLAYVPLQRMLAVALLHPKSTPMWTSSQWVHQMESPDSYVIMPALSDIVNIEESRETCANPFREEILKTLRGDYGEWRTIATACLLQSVLCADAMDAESLAMLEIVAGFGKGSTSLEMAVASFLKRPHSASAISATALECVGMLGLMLLYNGLVAAAVVGKEETEKRLADICNDSPVWEAMTQTRDSFCEQALQFREVTGVSDLFLDLVEAAIKTRYTPKYSESGPTIFTCLLNRRGHVDIALDADVLVREIRGVTHNDVESTRFCLNMGLHFRALCKVVDRLRLDLCRRLKNPTNNDPMDGIHLDMIDKADDLCETVGGLMQKPDVGADLDLTGRMYFPFKSATKTSDGHVQQETGKCDVPVEKTKKLGVFCSISQFILVLDPTDLFIVKPMKKIEDHRGTVLFALPLRSVIAAAADEDWLHIAVRSQDAGFLIKNGNMALKFETAGTCLIVKQYLDRSREVLRQELVAKVPDLLLAPKYKN
jgi:hypothetical protein